MNENMLPMSLAIWIVILAILLAFVVIERNELSREAIRRGHAEWVADEDGNTTFTWRTTK